jgi:hypothetical protein
MTLLIVIGAVLVVLGALAVVLSFPKAAWHEGAQRHAGFAAAATSPIDKLIDFIIWVLKKIIATSDPRKALKAIGVVLIAIGVVCILSGALIGGSDSGDKKDETTTTTVAATSTT